MNRSPPNITFAEALRNFRNEVNRKFPPQVGNNTSRVIRRQIWQTNTRHNAQRGRGNGRFPRGGRGRTKYHNTNRFRGRFVPIHGGRQTRNDSRMVKLTDGTTIEVHPSFSFPQDVWQVMPKEHKEYILKGRPSYSNNRSSREVTVEVPIDALSQISQLSTTTPTVITHTPHTITQAQVNNSNSNGSKAAPATISIHDIMGRRNSQH